MNAGKMKTNDDGSMTWKIKSSSYSTNPSVYKGNAMINEGRKCEKAISQIQYKLCDTLVDTRNEKTIKTMYAAQSETVERSMECNVRRRSNNGSRCHLRLAEKINFDVTVRDAAKNANMPCMSEFWLKQRTPRNACPCQHAQRRWMTTPGKKQKTITSR